MRSNNALALLSRTFPEILKRNWKIYTSRIIYMIQPGLKLKITTVLLTMDSIFILFRQSPNNINGKIKVLLSTSGTTGSPKFVKLSEENLLANADSIIDYLPIRKDDVTRLIACFYSYGLSILTTNSLVGGKVVCGGIDVLSRTFWRR